MFDFPIRSLRFILKTINTLHFNIFLKQINWLTPAHQPHLPNLHPATHQKWHNQPQESPAVGAGCMRLLAGFLLSKPLPW